MLKGINKFRGRFGRLRKYSTLREQVEMGQFHPEIYVYPTPRSYSSIEFFNISSVEFTKRLNCYVHIPFCPQLCDYCGYVKIMDDECLRSLYVDSVVKEISLYGDILKDKEIVTIHLGGGTPSVLSLNQIEQIMSKLLSYNPNIIETCEEISIETTPSNVDFDKFKSLKEEFYFNRVSVGIQSLNKEEIGNSFRSKNSPKTSLESLRILKEIGYENIVTDLILGLEGQTIQSFEATISKLLEYKPDCVEIYTIGVVPGTSFAKSAKKQNNSMVNNNVNEILKCLDLAREIFLNEGYIQQCHNRFAIEGRGTFLQEDYLWDDLSVIGFGAGTRTYAYNKHYRNFFYPNKHKKSIIEYIESMDRGEFAVGSGVEISEEEKKNQYCIYNIEELNKLEYFEMFGEEFENDWSEIYKDLVALDFIEEDENVIWLNNCGLNYRDIICWNFFSEKMKEEENRYRPKLI